MGVIYSQTTFAVHHNFNNKFIMKAFVAVISSLVAAVPAGNYANAGLGYAGYAGAIAAPATVGYAAAPAISGYAAAPAAVGYAGAIAAPAAYAAAPAAVGYAAGTIAAPAAIAATPAAVGYASAGAPLFFLNSTSRSQSFRSIGSLIKIALLSLEYLSFYILSKIFMVLKINKNFYLFPK